MKRKGPDFKARLGPEKDVWLKGMAKDGFKNLATWIKWVVRNHLNRTDDTR